MSHPVLYDEDILLWSEQQAEIIRKLGRTRRDLPNQFDVENVAEEIEGVGRSELAAVKSNIRHVLMDLIKLFVEPESEAVRHWRAEINAFHAALLDRYAPSMRQHLDMDALWRSVREQAMLAYADAQQQAVTMLPEASPFSLDDMLAGQVDSFALIARLDAAAPETKR